MVSARSFAFSAAVVAAAWVGTVDAYWGSRPYVYQVARDDAECVSHPNRTVNDVDAPAAFIDVVNLAGFIGKKAIVRVTGDTVDTDIEIKMNRQVFPVPPASMGEDGYAGVVIDGTDFVIGCFGDALTGADYSLMCSTNPNKASAKLAAGKSILYHASGSILEAFGHVVQEKGQCVAGGAFSKGVGLMTLMAAAAAMVFN